jgi:hypothetical protein
MTHATPPSRARRRFALAAGLLAGIALWGAPARAQDIADCNRTAQLDEMVICSEPRLLEADRHISEATWRLIGVLSEFQGPWLASWQSDWRAARARCADDNQPLDRGPNIERAVACLDKLYAERRREIDWLVERADADAPGAMDAAPCEALANMMRVRPPRSSLSLLHGSLREAIRVLGLFELVEPVQEQITLSRVLEQERLRDEDARTRQRIGRGGGEQFYQVDLDGDGRLDLVIESTGGALSCQRYHVYLRQRDNSLKAVRGPDLRGFEEEGGLCETHGVTAALVRAPDERISLALMDHAFGVAPIYFYRLAPDGSAPLQCRVVLGLPNGRSVIDHKQPQLPAALRAAR